MIVRSLWSRLGVGCGARKKDSFAADQPALTGSRETAHFGDSVFRRSLTVEAHSATGQTGECARSRLRLKGRRSLGAHACASRVGVPSALTLAPQGSAFPRRSRLRVNGRCSLGAHACASRVGVPSGAHACASMVGAPSALTLARQWSVLPRRSRLRVNGRCSLGAHACASKVGAPSACFVLWVINESTAAEH